MDIKNENNTNYSKDFGKENLEFAVAFKPKKDKLKQAVGFHKMEDIDSETGKARDNTNSILYADPQFTAPMYLEEPDAYTVAENPQNDVVHALVTEHGLLIDDMTRNRPAAGLERAVIFWGQIKELPEDYREKIRAAICDGDIEVEKIRDHAGFWNGYKDRFNCSRNPEITEIQCVTELVYEPYVADYVKQGEWILECVDEERGTYRKLFRCDIKCITVKDEYNSEQERIRRLLKLQVKTRQDEAFFDVDLTWDGNKIQNLFRKVLGFKVDTGVQFEREMKNLLAELTIEAPITKVLIEQGWQSVNGKMRYVYDGRTDIGEYKVICGKNILQNVNYNIVDIWNNALKVFNQKRVAGPILCYALYGVTYRLFVDAHHRPTGILFVAGETGAMKTSLSKVFFLQFNTDEDVPVIPFQSTRASIDPAIRDAKDALLVVDDYCPNSTMTPEGRKGMQMVLDYLIRIYGDATARRKSTVNSEMIKSPRATGGAVATGEIEAEGRSSCLRLITVELRRGDICGEALQLFQDNRDMWSTFMAYYIRYLEEHYGQIVQIICNMYPKLRDEASKWLRERRDVDHYVECTIINYIVCGFLQTSGMVNKDVENMFGLLDDGLKYHIMRSELLAKEQNPAQLMLEAVVSVLTNGRIKIAESFRVYADNGEYAGYIHEDGRYYVEEAALKSEVERQLKSEFGNVGFDRKNFLKILHGQFGIIKKFKNGGENYKYTTRIKKLENKVQIVVVNLNKAEAILSEA